MSDCPSPTVPGSGHMNFADDDVIDEAVEQAARNIASIDSKLAILKVNKTFSLVSKSNNYLSNIYFFIIQNKCIPLIDLQKSSNTVALVESFLGEFKPDDESVTEPVTQDKSNVKPMVNVKNEAVDDPQPTQEILINNINNSMSIKNENKVSSEVTDQPDITDVCPPVHKLDESAKICIEECIRPVVEQPPSSPSPPPPPPPPPVKRKVRLS